MGTLGEWLRAARQERGITLSQVEQATKIRHKYLMALEEEDSRLLPPEVYTLSFLKTYCRYLALDPEAGVRRYFAWRGRPEPEGLQPAIRPLRWSVTIGANSLVAMLTVLALALLGYYAYHQYTIFRGSLAASSGTPELGVAPTPVRLPPVAYASAPEEPQATGPSPAARPLPTATLIPGVSLEISARARCWLRVIVDGRVAFEGFLSPGQTRTWTGREMVFIRAGNAGGIEITYNGKKLGLFGASGEVKEGTWTAPATPR